MRKQDDDIRTRELYDVAHFFHREKLTKTEIGTRMGISGTQARRLLDEAEQRGIVKISLIPPRIMGLEESLKEHFPCLREVTVIPDSPGNEQLQLSKLGEAGARYFDSIVETIERTRRRETVKVALSGGNTIYEMVQALEHKERNIEIYPAALIGRGPFIPHHIDPLVLITMLQNKSGNRKDSAYYVTVQPFDSDRHPADIVRDNEALKLKPKMKRVWEGMQHVDLVFASVGCFRTQKQRTLLEMLMEIGITQATLEQDGIVGDIAYSMFDAQGNQRNPHQAEGDLFLTLGVKRLQTMAAQYPQQRVVLIAGRNKEEALLGALRGQSCNVLITDDATAESLLAKTTAAKAGS